MEGVEQGGGRDLSGLLTRRARTSHHGRIVGITRVAIGIRHGSHVERVERT
jgi:hypothetical protein